jgi:hypothetical protein
MNTKRFRMKMALCQLQLQKQEFQEVKQKQNFPNSTRNSRQNTIPRIPEFRARKTHSVVPSFSSFFVFQALCQHWRMSEVEKLEGSGVLRRSKRFGEKVRRL